MVEITYDVKTIGIFRPKERAEIEARRKKREDRRQLQLLQMQLKRR